MRPVAPGTAFHTLFAEEYCGYFGTVNSARGSERKGIVLQLEDWKKIKKML